MRNFVFHNPTKIIFGNDATNEVGKEVRNYGKRVLLITGQGSIKRIGLYDKVINLLKKENLEIYELSGVKPNPRVDLVREGIKIVRENQIDILLAVGGGSVIDTAKAIAAGLTYDGDVWDLFTKRIPIKPTLAIGVVLTLAATGSEMNGNAVISNMETQEKLAISSPYLYPKFSILDPKNTVSVPLNHTLYGIVDILSHVFEQYFDKTKDAILQDRFAESIMKTVIETAPKLVENPEDLESRAVILWCGTNALNGIIGVGKEQDWASHAIEHAISAIYDIPHGLGLAIVFPHWMKYVIDVIPHKFANFARNVWNIQGDDDFEVGLKGIEKLIEFYESLGIPTKLSRIGINNERLEEMAEKATQFGPIGNVKKLTREDVYKILELCL
ncbi:MAG: iron-containing alcohol dehydrogenase [Dictyoglomus thermophilum]|nr:iron-containing alcohol dehydrogenase [Dictyoglomus thermophilum]MCX7720511.1 iron-containing alcohol dehydrogenase [Dictyoglomus thermophilum]